MRHPGTVGLFGAARGTWLRVESAPGVGARLPDLAKLQRRGVPDRGPASVDSAPGKPGRCADRIIAHAEARLVVRLTMA